ncbi:MAG TPA: c-type cytochrome, partial [Longimicrobiaceae bacterium]|nr:c-type cytochrome [Longimicrobiaceae bacterium]
PVGETPEYGRYLASSTCVECHGRSLEGGTHPDPSGPPVPGLSHTSQWSFEEFATALRTGKVPGGRTVKTQFMPIRFFGHLTDSELRALRAYIATLQPGAPPTTAR